MKKMFFGWSNIKWLIKEFMAMYSNKESYFSKKRFESSIAFLTAMTLIVEHVYYTRDKISNSEVLADVTLLFIIAGYTVNQIQTEKKITVPQVEEIKVENPKIVVPTVVPNQSEAVSDEEPG